MKNNNSPDNVYVLIAQQEWALNLGSNAKNIAIEISKTHKVIYVNPALDLNTLVKNILSAAGRRRLLLGLGLLKNTVKVEDNVWVHTPATIAISINWLNNSSIFNAINKLNAFGFFNSVNKAINKLGWAGKQLTVFNDSQMFTGRYTKQLLNPANNFYYIRDNLVKHPYFIKHGERIEPETIGQADIVFANSAYLANYARQYNGKSFDIGQGCELDLYDTSIPAEEPRDLQTIPHPRIGYAGFLTGERLDILLLETLALQKPEWHFVLIGPEEIMFKQSRLHQLKNVHFTGAKKSSQLPAYLKHVDVCINPQLVNDLTIGNYPRKIDEYLALGKPTVATDTPAMKMFLPHVYLAKGTEEYITAINKALLLNDAQAVSTAISFARSHTWQACVNSIYEKQQTING